MPTSLSLALQIPVPLGPGPGLLCLSDNQWPLLWGLLPCPDPVLSSDQLSSPAMPTHAGG